MTSRRFAVTELLALVAVATLALSACTFGSPRVSEDIDWPDGVSAAVGLLDDTIVYSHLDDDAQPIASLAKVVAALVVLDSGVSTSETVTAQLSDQRISRQIVELGGIAIPVEAGRELSVRELLEGSLVVSASNFTEMLVVAAFGSTEQYVDAARRYLVRHDLAGITIADAAGMTGGSLATAADMVRVGKLALGNNVIAEVVGMRSVTVEGVEYPNTNLLLLEPGWLGIKTGTDAAHHLLFAREVDGVVIIGTVLGASASGYARQAAHILTDEVQESLGLTRRITA